MARAARPTWLCVPEMGRTSAVDDMASASASSAGSIGQPNTISAPPISSAVSSISAAPMPNTIVRIATAAEAELQPDREQQEDDAEFGERLDAVRIGNGTHESQG